MWTRLLCAALVCWLFADSTALAQLRQRTTMMIVPLSAGTGLDVLARALGERLAERMGTPFVVENRSGASSHLGSQHVATAPPDGHTLLVTTGIIFSEPAMNDRPQPKFEPVILLASGQNGMVVGPRTTAKSVKEIEAIARENPGKLFYSAAGNGSVHTIAMELFKYLTKTDIARVPFKSSTEALNYVVFGQVDMMTVPVAASSSLVQGGQLRMLATLSDRRAQLFPDVPTIVEVGYPEMSYDSQYYLFAPLGTPANIVERLNKEANAIIQEPTFQPILAKLGLRPEGGTPAQLAGVIGAEQDRLQKLVKQSRK